MTTSMRIAVVLALMVAVLAVVLIKADFSRTAHSGVAGASAPGPSAGEPRRGAAALPSAATQRMAAGLPHLVDLGAGYCIPCKQMVPILDELKTAFAGRLDVQFIDVSLAPSAARSYGIRLIPTQIFYDADGNELSRHEGFMAKEDILARFREHGIDLAHGAAAP